MTVKLLIDGQETPFQNDVKIIYEADEDQDEQLHMTYTHEGLVEDLLHDDEVVKTNNVTYVEICEALENS